MAEDTIPIAIPSKGLEDQLSILTIASGSAPFLFLCLSGEMRNTVYEYILANTDAGWTAQPCPYHRAELLICKLDQVKFQSRAAFHCQDQSSQFKLGKPILPSNSSE
jgi:hypothetical protein